MLGQKSKPNWLLYLLVVFALALALVACGADDGDGDLNTNETTEDGGGFGLPGEEEGLGNDNDIFDNDNGALDIVTPTVMPEMTAEATPMPIETPVVTVEATSVLTPEVTDVPPQATVTSSAQEPTDEMMTTGAFVVRGSDLLGLNVYDATGEGIAEVDEVLFDRDGTLRYIILDLDDDLDDIGMARLVPWEMIGPAILQNQMMTGTADVETGSFIYEDALTDYANWPQYDDELDISDNDLIFEMDDTLDTTTPLTDTTSTAATMPSDLNGLLRLSAISGWDLFDYDMLSVDNEDIGEIEDVLVDLNQERVAYAMADVGGFLGLAETTVAIPWERFTLVDNNTDFQVDVTEEELLNAPPFDTSRWNEEGWPNTEDWDQDIRNYWDSVIR
jgi:sporulation protein YlmC with PRC-barrel domain